MDAQYESWAEQLHFQLSQSVESRQRILDDCPISALTVNFLGPSDPCRSLNPLTGVLEVPVVNCRSLDRFSIGQDFTACDVHVSTDFLIR